MGQYASTSRDADWTSDNLLSASSTVHECTAKTEPSCAEFATYFLRGTSNAVDDWKCQNTPTHIVLCEKEYHAATRTMLTGLQIGLPELVSPFTKSFVASAKVPGYSRVRSRAVVAVTGTRFVSDGERIAAPRSRPLLVLHDPPASGTRRVCMQDSMALGLEHNILGACAGAANYAV